MLLNIQNHGWDSCYNGLAINWNETNGETVINWNGTGEPDPSPCTRHEDRMTTLRYFHALLLYKADTGTHEFDSEIARIQAHILTLFTTANSDERGWAYSEFVDIAALTGKSVFKAIANAMLAWYAQILAQSNMPDYQFEEASALVQSGVAVYKAQGVAALQNLWKADFLPQINLINLPTLKTAQEGDIAIALVRAGMASKASLLLKGMQAFWDPTYGGYVQGGVYTNGQLTVDTKKTSGRMLNMLELGKLLGNSQLVTTLDNLFYQHIYQTEPSGYEGVLYEQNKDWSPYILNGQIENWNTSEAMGISLVALLMRGR